MVRAVLILRDDGKLAVAMQHSFLRGMNQTRHHSGTRGMDVCVQVAALRRADPVVQEVLPTV
jgi:hypothetical protein